jgi:Tfp pilus assembly protein PilF
MAGDLGKTMSEQAQFHFQRALEMRRLQRHDEAIESYDHAIRLQPSFAKAHSNRGNALLDLNRFEEAMASYDLAVSFAPDYAMGHYNRAVALQKLNRLDEALISYELAIANDADYGMAHCNRGNVLLEFNRIADAIVSYDRTITIDPSYADAYWNKSLALLLSGEFVAGWQIYEWRWQSILKSAHRTFEQPLWNGTQDLSGKCILLHAEQGLGDTIHFCRYVQLVKDMGAFVVLEVPDSLKALFLGLSGVDALIARGDPLPKFDLHCPLLSLPLAFKTDLTKIPSPAAYLHSTPEARARWQARLGSKTRPRIGLVWSGNSQNNNDHKRSLPLAKLWQYLPKGFEYVALQKEVREADQEVLQQSGIHHFGDQLVDFVDTAALCDLMDLVVSVDTSVAHLAGAMGKPTWILLPFAPDWRWLLDRDDSPWYGSVKLYRQDADRDWSQVLARLASDLESFEYL